MKNISKLIKVGAIAGLAIANFAVQGFGISQKKALERYIDSVGNPFFIQDIRKRFSLCDALMECRFDDALRISLEYAVPYANRAISFLKRLSEERPDLLGRLIKRQISIVSYERSVIEELVNSGKLSTEEENEEGIQWCDFQATYIDFMRFPENWLCLTEDPNQLRDKNGANTMEKIDDFIKVLNNLSPNKRQQLFQAMMGSNFKVALDTVRLYLKEE